MHEKSPSVSKRAFTWTRMTRSAPIKVECVPVYSGNRLWRSVCKVWRHSFHVENIDVFSGPHQVYIRTQSRTASLSLISDHLYLGLFFFVSWKLKTKKTIRRFTTLRLAVRKKSRQSNRKNALIITTILLWTILNNAKHFN